MACRVMMPKKISTMLSQLAQQIQQDTGVKPPFSLEAFEDLEEDVRQSITRIKGSPFLLAKDSVRGFIYEVESGRLREVTY